MQNKIGMLITESLRGDFLRQFNVTGMSCAACSARVEKAVSALEGIDSVSVNLLTNSMIVEGTTDVKKIIDAVENAGYGAIEKNKNQDKKADGIDSDMEESLKVDFLDDDEIKVVLGNNSFEKIYTYYFNKVSLDKKNNSLENNGRWIKYDKGSDCVTLVKSLEGRATGWCTASMGTAEKQLSLGDFYVYYTLDEEGEYKIPRIAIRMEGDSIAEVRGIANNQEIEDDMHDVITKKLKEFPDSELYLKKVSDMKMMTNIYRKDEKGEELTREELRFLYQIDSKIVGFGYGRDPRIVELTLKRNKRSDFAIMYNCREDQIAFSLDELLANNEEIVCCFVNMSDRDIPENKLYFPKLRYVGANINFREVKEVDCFKVLEYVLNDFNCPNATSISGVDNLWYIGIDAKFNSLKNGECFKNLKYIGLHAYFDSLEKDDLLNLEYIGGAPCFDYLESINGIKNEYINKRIDEYYRFNKKERRR